MFNFLNLGFEGYRRIAQSDMANARMLSRALESSGYFAVRIPLLPILHSGTSDTHSSWPRMFVDLFFSALATSTSLSAQAKIRAVLLNWAKRSERRCPRLMKMMPSSIGRVCQLLHSGKFASRTQCDEYLKKLIIIFCLSRFNDQFKNDYPHVQQAWIQNLVRHVPRSIEIRSVSD